MPPARVHKRAAFLVRLGGGIVNGVAMYAWELAGAVAEKQHQWVATWQAEAVGVQRRALSRRVHREGWPRPFRGVTGWPGPSSPLRDLAALVVAYGRPGGAAGRISVEGDDALAFAEAVAAAALGAGQAVTGRSGAWLHGFAPPPKQHALWLPSESGRITRPDARLRYGGQPPGEMTYRSGLPVFDPIGCVVETARTPMGTWEERVDECVWQLSRADSQRLFTLDDAEARLDELRGICGADVLIAAINRARGTLSHSRPEHRGRTLVGEAVAPLGFTPSVRPYEVFLGTRRVGEADIAIVPLRFDIEIDGPHHRFLEQRLKDEARDKLMRRAQWEVERFPDTLVRERPKVFIARVREAVEARAAAIA